MAFRKLLVWQKSMQFAKDVYALTKKLPSDEQFGLIAQMRRCAISIPSNIAEGYQRSGDKELARFLYIARGSAAELQTQLLLVRDIFHTDLTQVEMQVTEVQKLISGLLRKL